MTVGYRPKPPRGGRGKPTEREVIDLDNKTDAQKKARKKYDKQTYERIAFILRYDSKELNGDIIRAHAAERGESLNGFITRAMYETIERDKKTPMVEKNVSQPPRFKKSPAAQNDGKVVDRIALILRRDSEFNGDAVRMHAAKRSESLNDFLKRAAEETYNHDKSSDSVIAHDYTLPKESAVESKPPTPNGNVY